MERTIVGFRLRSDGHHGNTRVNGYDVLNTSGAHNAPNIRLDSGSSEAFGLAPAMEYNLNRNLGVPPRSTADFTGRNATAAITPELASNNVH